MEIPAEFFQGNNNNNNYYHSQFTPDRRQLSDAKNFIDELLNYPSDDNDDDNHLGMLQLSDATVGNGFTGNSTHSSTLVDTSCNSTGSTALIPFGGGGDTTGYRNFTDQGHFSTELCVPYDDIAELEWVSHFAEEAFSSEDLQNMHLISGIETRNNNNNNNTEFQTEPNRATAITIFRPDMAVPAKARSKRSRAPPCNWTSRLLAVSPSLAITATPLSAVPAEMLSSSESIGSNPDKKTIKAKKKETSRNGNGMITNSEGRRCLHCATDQTPQWRTGPMGPKTLCNACGVRYKSGRLLPEYRPAASPTFMLAKHSNSHRKVMELRRQNEVSSVQRHQQQQFLHQNMMFNVSNVDDFLIHQHIGPDYRQLI